MIIIKGKTDFERPVRYEEFALSATVSLLTSRKIYHAQAWKKYGCTRRFQVYNNVDTQKY